MSVQLNHTIVAATDPHTSAQYLADLLDLDAPVRFGPFMEVQMDNELTLDYLTETGQITSQHYAFLVSDDVFDRAFERITSSGQDYWADPGLREQGRINTNDGGRGVYFHDPDGHLLELITVPYGGWPPDAA
ncbi:MAG: VOC family protein [Euzebya sp.]